MKNLIVVMILLFTSNLYAQTQAQIDIKNNAYTKKQEADSAKQAAYNAAGIADNEKAQALVEKNNCPDGISKELGNQEMSDGDSDADTAVSSYLTGNVCYGDGEPELQAGNTDWNAGRYSDACTHYQNAAGEYNAAKVCYEISLDKFQQADAHYYSAINWYLLGQMGM